MAKLRVVLVDPLPERILIEIKEKELTFMTGWGGSGTGNFNTVDSFPNDIFRTGAA